MLVSHQGSTGSI